ncbi:MAG: hypothetical protein R3C61_00980 [Bacteroidia bacterium]
MKRENFSKPPRNLARISLPWNPLSLNLSSQKSRRVFLGTPVLPEYLFDRGIANCLDAMRELAGINTVATFSHDHVFNQYQKNYRPKTDENGRRYTNTWVKLTPDYYPI